jgi:hypothetical protein
MSEQSVGNGLTEIDIAARTTGAVPAALAIRLVGTPDARGGLIMQRGTSTFGPAAVPTQYEGPVVGLDGSRLALALRDSSGTSLDLQVDLHIDGSGVSGVLSVADSSSGDAEGSQ